MKSIIHLIYNRYIPLLLILSVHPYIEQYRLKQIIHI